MNVLKFCIMCFYGTLPNQCVFHEKNYVMSKGWPDLRLWKWMCLNLVKAFLWNFNFLTLSVRAFSFLVFQQIFPETLTFFIFSPLVIQFTLTPLMTFTRSTQDKDLLVKSFTISSCYRKLSWVYAWEKKVAEKLCNYQQLSNNTGLSETTLVYPYAELNRIYRQIKTQHKFYMFKKIKCDVLVLFVFWFSLILRKNHCTLSMLDSQLNSVPPFLTIKLPKLLNRNSKSLSLAFSFSNLRKKKIRGKK